MTGHLFDGLPPRVAGAPATHPQLAGVTHHGCATSRGDLHTAVRAVHESHTPTAAPVPARECTGESR